MGVDLDGIDVGDLGWLPARIAVLVDDLRPDALSHVVAAQKADRQPELLRERLLQPGHPAGGA